MAFLHFIDSVEFLKNKHLGAKLEGNPQNPFALSVLRSRRQSKMYRRVKKISKSLYKLQRTTLRYILLRFATKNTQGERSGNNFIFKTQQNLVKASDGVFSCCDQL